MLPSPPPDNLPTNPVIEEILRRRFPQTVLIDAVAAVIKATGQTDNGVTEQHKATVQAERERLQAVPQAELLQNLQALKAKSAADERTRLALKQQKDQEKAAAKEAAKFYNKPNAIADFDFWLKADFWSFDESIALLLGKEPSVVNPASVKRELESIALFEAKAPLSAFLKTYQRLRALAQRSEAMTRATRLRPSEVIAWARRVAVVELPEQLQGQVLPAAVLEPAAPAVLGSKEASPAAAIAAPPAAELPPQGIIKKAALIGKYEASWPTIHSDLGHANENGLSQVAKAKAHGKWDEGAAIQWAKQNGKIRATLPNHPPSLDQLPRRIIRIGD